MLNQKVGETISTRKEKRGRDGGNQLNSFRSCAWRKKTDLGDRERKREKCNLCVKVCRCVLVGRVGENERERI